MLEKSLFSIPASNLNFMGADFLKTPLVLLKLLAELISVDIFKLFKINLSVIPFVLT